MSTTEFLLRIVVPILFGMAIGFGLMAAGYPCAALFSNAVMMLTFGLNMAFEAIRRIRIRSD